MNWLKHCYITSKVILLQNLLFMGNLPTPEKKQIELFSD